MTQPSFVFRADASLVIGSGHVMRCLTLAKALRILGSECHFVSRDLQGNLLHRIEGEGFKAHALTAETSVVPKQDDYTTWAQVTWRQDAEQTVKVVEETGADWVVVDHYGFDARWQNVVVPEHTKCLVIDDLANRPHACDVLLDANFGRNSTDYRDLVPAGCPVLVGPQFALLRPEFSEIRAETLFRRQTNCLQNILINFGGIDLCNATAATLSCLAKSNLPRDISVTVVMGGQSPFLSVVQDLCKKLPFEAEVRVDVSDMHRMMATADLAIGAVGGTTWERAALGLPTLMLTIASNQEPAAYALDAANRGVWLGSSDGNAWQEKLQISIQSLFDTNQLAAQSEIAATVCDGDGTGRVIAHLTESLTVLRAPELADARRVWEWRHADGAHQFNKNADPIPYDQHYLWFRGMLEREDVFFCILTKAQNPLGYIRLDRFDEHSARISLCLSGSERGKGLGRVALEHAHRSAKELDIHLLIAEVHPKNVASQKLFKSMGYQELPSKDGFSCFELDLTARRST